jgi:hypothetical protein
VGQEEPAEHVVEALHHEEYRDQDPRIIHGRSATRGSKRRTPESRTEAIEGGQNTGAAHDRSLQARASREVDEEEADENRDQPLAGDAGN